MRGGVGGLALQLETELALEALTQGACVHVCASAYEAKERKVREKSILQESKQVVLATSTAKIESF